jgi:hypothetical protein
MDTQLIKSVARGLRYRSLDHLIGRAIEIHDLDQIEDAVRFGLGPDMPEDCRLAGPERHTREVAVAKYGILDLRFTAPGNLLTGEARTGVRLLRELGYLPKHQDPQQRVGDYMMCLTMLQENLTEGRTYFRLFLKDGRPRDEAIVNGPDGDISLRVPDSYLPQAFRIIDACVSNAASVWLWKHFYL